MTARTMPRKPMAEFLHTIESDILGVECFSVTPVVDRSRSRSHDSKSEPSSKEQAVFTFCLHPGVHEQDHGFVVLQKRASYRLKMCVVERRIKVLVARPDPTAVDATQKRTG